MEPPSKRPRLSNGMGPGDFDMDEARTRNNLRLKSRFESIFEKYGKDFSDMGDEIDLKTGKIVVDNGHIQEMQNEQDIGQIEDDFDVDDTHSSEKPELDVYWADQSKLFDNIGPAHGDDLNGLQDECDTYLPARTERASGIQQGHFDPLRGQSDSQGGESEDDDPLLNCLSINPVLETPRLLKDSPPKRGHETPKNSILSKSHGQRNGYERKEDLQTHDIARTPAIDPLWRTPEIQGGFPSHISKSVPIFTPPDRALSSSPPNTKSIWAAPGARRPRKDKGITRKPKLPRSSQLNRKLFSTPDLQAFRKRNFSDVGGESDSDDPLQDEFFQTPIRRSSPSVLKLANGSTISNGSGTGGQKFCKFCRKYFSGLQFGRHFDTVLSNGRYDGIHDLGEVGRLRDALVEPVHPEKSDEQEHVISTPIPSEVSKPAPPMLEAPEATVSPTLYPPQRQTISSPNPSPPKPKEKEARHSQYVFDKETTNGVDPSMDPLADDFDDVSSTSGLSSIQIEPSSVASTPRGKQGASSPFAALSSAKRNISERRQSMFGLNSNRPIRVPIFRRTNF